MWCKVSSNQCSDDVNRSNRARMSGPRSRSNAARASARACCRASDSRSSGVRASNSSTPRANSSCGEMACTVPPSRQPIRVRKISCLRTSSFSASRSATGCSSPDNRNACEMLYTEPVGSNRSSNHKRCCAKDSGAANSTWPRRFDLLAHLARQYPVPITAEQCQSAGYRDAPALPARKEMLHATLAIWIGTTVRDAP